ncbi:MAG: cation:proton antiporter [Bacteroidales bacterium]|nr:cation:proton antiporter [Bacteroidales bacterium]
MSEELNLVKDLALILISAGLFTIISKWLKQPLILGYIVAGFLVGPHLGLFPTVTSVESVDQWSEIGIIFLLFSLGLEFSFKKLLKVGSAALITAGTNCVGMFMVGIVTGSALGWTMMESIFLGGMLSMSSTTIIIKAFDDLHLKDESYASLVFGILIIEDLIAVLLMVLLSTLAVSNKFAGGEMLMGLAKLAFFLILWFLVGIYVIPSVLKRVKQYLSDEILLLVSIGLCFGMVTLASAVGFSSALGAFVMGSLLSETLEGERIEHLTHSLKDLFGAIFFVSVGMMVDPAVIGAHWGAVLALTLVAMAGILCFSVTGVIISGRGLSTALHTGFSLAQLGEFSFIIAGLGVSLGVLRGFIYPIIISVSVITTFTTPYMIKAAAPAEKWLRRKLPARFLARIDPPQEETGASRAVASEWHKLLKNYALRLVLYGVIITAILIGTESYLHPLLERLLPDWSTGLHSLLDVLITLALLSPFLYGLAISGSKIRSSAGRLLRENRANRWPVLALMLLRIAIAIAIIMLVILSHFHLRGWAILLVIAAAFFLLVAARLTMHNYSGLEERFMSNLNERDNLERLRNPVSSSVREKMAGYDVHIEQFKVPQNFAYVGQALREMPFRNTSGINIIKIVRGAKSILIPSGDERIFPFDTLVAVGTTEQIRAFRQTLRESTVSAPAEETEFSVEPVTLHAGSYLVGQTLRTADMRSGGCMVISVLRGDEFITNPKPDFAFREGDTVWLAGEKSGVAFYGA